MIDARVDARVDACIDDCGMSTVEYAIGLLAAAALATALLVFLSGGDVADLIGNIVRRAFDVNF